MQEVVDGGVPIALGTLVVSYRQSTPEFEMLVGCCEVYRGGCDYAADNAPTVEEIELPHDWWALAHGQFRPASNCSGLRLPKPLCSRLRL